MRVIRVFADHAELGAFLAFLFAIFGIMAGCLGIGTYAQINSIVEAGAQLGVERLYSAIAVTLIVGWIIYGGLKYIANDVYMDFQWSGKVFDVCNPVERTLTIEKIRMIDGAKAEADLFYEDPPCYEFRYTLLLEFKDGEWYIADVIWKSATPTRETEEARKYIAGQIKHFQELDANGMDKLLDEVEVFVPTYDEGTIFKENPEEVGIYLNNISNLQKMLKKNPKYKASYDEWFSSYSERVRKEAAEHGIEIQ